MGESASPDRALLACAHRSLRKTESRPASRVTIRFRGNADANLEGLCPEKRKGAARCLPQASSGINFSSFESCSPGDTPPGQRSCVFLPEVKRLPMGCMRGACNPFQVGKLPQNDRIDSAGPTISPPKDFISRPPKKYEESPPRPETTTASRSGRNSKSSSSTARASTLNCSRPSASINAPSRNFLKPVMHGTTSRSKKSSSPWASAALAST